MGSLTECHSLALCEQITVLSCKDIEDITIQNCLQRIDAANAALEDAVQDLQRLLGGTHHA